MHKYPSYPTYFFKYSKCDFACPILRISTVWCVVGTEGILKRLSKSRSYLRSGGAEICQTWDCNTNHKILRNNINLYLDIHAFKMTEIRKT